MPFQVVEHPFQPYQTYENSFLNINIAKVQTPAQIQAKVEEFDLPQPRSLLCLQQKQQFTHRPLAASKVQRRKIQTDSFTQKRNIVPNNINHILAFVQRRSKSQSIVERVISKYDVCEKFTSKRFYCYQAQLKEKLYIHVNTQTLGVIINHLDLHSQIFAVDEQLFYNRVCRVLIRYYLREKAALTTLSSYRVKQTSKKDHLKVQRTLLNLMHIGTEEA